MPKPISSARVNSGLSIRHDTPPENPLSGILTSVYDTTAKVSQASPSAALYAPFASKDMVEKAVGFNIARLVAGKPVYPLIARNDKECGELEQWRRSKIEQLNEKTNSASLLIKAIQDKSNLTRDALRIEFGAKAFDKLSSDITQLQRTVDTLNHLEILSNQTHRKLAALRPGVDKLYLLGHGAPGVGKLSADPSGLPAVTAKELARQLATGGLNVKFKDFRVAACHSADARYPESFKPGDLIRAAQVAVETDGYWNCFGFGTSPDKPFAQSLCNELKKAGFKQPEVSGYHGSSVTYSTTHHYCRLPDTQEEDVRSSTVRRRFTPTRRILSLVGL